MIMRRRFIFILSLFLHLFSSCTGDVIVPAEPQLVVEGWIDDGGFPVVMFSTTIPVGDEEIKMDDLKQYIVNWGKVTVSDGEKEVVLTGMRSSSYFPPYIYTTTKIRGEAGKTYRLVAEYDNIIATAQTTIPPRAEIESIESDYTDGKYTIMATIKDNPDEHNYYKFFIKVLGRDTSYLSSDFAIFDDSNYSSPIKVPVEIGNSFFYSAEKKNYELSEEDGFWIKVAQVDSVAYDFWDDYKNMVELGVNPFFKYSGGIRSNISGGLGYWIGYGATEYYCAPYNHATPVKINK